MRQGFVRVLNHSDEAGEANRDIVVLSLLSSPTGHLTNLSRADPTRTD